MDVRPRFPIRYAVSVARRWHGWLLHREPEDADQALWVAILTSDDTCDSIQRAVNREMRRMAKAYGYRTGRRDPVAAYTEDAGYRRVKSDPSMRPSKIVRRTGYRRDPNRHAVARAKVPAARRAEIARKGAAARWHRDENSFTA